MSLESLEPLVGRTLVLVAHPDDENISCGGLLQHMREPIVLFATDGAPEDEYFWGRFGSRQEYAKVREREARAALSEIGVSEVEFLTHQTEGPLVDQMLFRSLSQAFASLCAVVERRRPECLLTLAYEGGHPDHDSCSFLSSQLRRNFSIPVWEAPLYHRNQHGESIHQRFIADAGQGIEHAVRGEELEAKLRMLSCYKSQLAGLPPFDAELERFRPQAEYDYSRRPHAGKLNYEHWQWRMTAEEVCAAFMDFSSSVAPLQP